MDELSQSSEWRSHLRPFDNHLSVAGIVAGGSHPHISSQGQYHTLEGPDESHDVEVGIYVPTQVCVCVCVCVYACVHVHVLQGWIIPINFCTYKLFIEK